VQGKAEVSSRDKQETEVVSKLRSKMSFQGRDRIQYKNPFAKTINRNHQLMPIQ